MRMLIEYNLSLTFPLLCYNYVIKRTQSKIYLAVVFLKVVFRKGFHEQPLSGVKVCLRKDPSSIVRSSHLSQRNQIRDKFEIHHLFRKRRLLRIMILTTYVIHTIQYRLEVLHKRVRFRTISNRHCATIIRHIACREIFNEIDSIWLDRVPEMSK